MYGLQFEILWNWLKFKFVEMQYMVGSITVYFLNFAVDGAILKRFSKTYARGKVKESETQS